MIPETGAWPGI